MAEEAVEVTTEGIREPPKNAPPRWTQAYDEWSEEESEWSSDGSSFAVHSFTRPRTGSRKRGLLLCLFTFCLAAIIAGLVVAVVIPMNNRKERSTNAAAASSGGDVVNESQPPTASPTAAPTTALGLPEACTPHYNNVDYCLVEELTTEEANACINCVWDWLPPKSDQTGNCVQQEAIICNILSQCECGPCATFLEGYLDCQSSCEFNCQLATERANDGD